jgi:tetratricopeptide (TPR) repeat protein
MLYSRNGNYQEAINVLEKSFKYLPDWVPWAYQHIASIRLVQGKWELSVQALNQALSHSSHPSIKTGDKTRRGDLYFFRNNLEQSLKIYQKSIPIYNQPWHRKANVYLSQGKVKKALDVLNNKRNSLLMEIKKNPDPYLKYLLQGIYERLAWFDIRFGKPDQVPEKLKKHSALLSSNRRITEIELNLFIQAYAFITDHQLEQAEIFIKKIQKAVPPMFKKSDRNDFQSNLCFLRGHIALKKGYFEEAIKELEQAVSRLNAQYYDAFFWPTYHAPFIDSLAQAYLKNNDAEKAAQSYERIQNLTYGRFQWGDIYAKSFYELGKIYQQKGWKGKALESYNQFIDQWKDCNPEFKHMVEDARKRLSELVPGQE